MKVAISIPDDVFQAAERVSRRMRIPRSQLYAKAIKAFVRDHSDEDITEQLNRVYSKVSSKLDPAWEKMSLEVLRRAEWKE
jgi:antitoxin MazE6